MDTTLRAYAHTDRQACLEAFRSNVPDYFTEEEIQDFECFLERLENGSDPARYYVVIYGRQVIGCGGFGEKDDSGVFSLVWGLIHRNYHKSGFGEQLLQYRIAQMKQLKPEFQLVLDTTQHSYAFFEKYGFHTTKVTCDYYATGMHRYDMILTV